MTKDTKQWRKCWLSDIGYIWDITKGCLKRRYTEGKTRVGHEEIWLTNILCRRCIVGKILKCHIFCLIESVENLGWLSIMTKYFLGRHNRCPLTRDRDPMTDWSMGIIKVQLDKPMRFIGVTHRSMNEELHTGAVKAYPRKSDSSHKLGTWIILYRL